ncbi:MAG TPA: DUF6340 family protein [Prolixibacteraceae bacterium]|nr:DUF6340 family protein [Prolixibacteraceae bacterium]
MNRITLATLVLFTVFTSCTVYQNYPIEVYKPGEIEVPSTVENVALVYRNFKYPADTLQHFYKKDYRLVKAKNDPENLDSLVVMSCLNALADKLRTNGSFKQVRVIPYNVFRQHTSEKLPPLDFDVVKKLTGASSSDLLISLETLSYFYATYPENYETMSSDEVITAAAWGIYNPVNQKIIEHKTLIDTVVWHGYDENGNYDRDYKAPPRFTALKIAASLAGENYSKRFFSSWKKVDRTYSIPPLPDFSEAAYYFEEGKWDTAIGLWKKYAGEKNGKMAINARYNIALAHEIKDELDLAIKWLDAARDLAVKLRSKDDLKRIFAYQRTLEKRKADLEQLIQ